MKNICFNIQLLLICLFFISFTTSAHSDEQLIFGVVPQFDLRKLHSIWNPVLDKLNQRTSINLKLHLTQSIPHFEKELYNARYDCAYMNPYHLIMANNKHGYLPIIRDIGRKLHGIIVVNKESGLINLIQLQNKIIAFPAPNALAASLIIRTELREKFDINFESVYVKSHTSVYLNVAIGKADAGGGVQKTFDVQTKQIKDKLKIIYRTHEISPHPIACHPRVSKNIVNQIKSAFLEMVKNEEENKLLNKIPMKKAGIAKLADYDELKKLGLEKYYVKE